MPKSGKKKDGFEERTFLMNATLTLTREWDWLSQLRNRPPIAQHRREILPLSDPPIIYLFLFGMTRKWDPPVLDVNYAYTCPIIPVYFIFTATHKSKFGEWAWKTELIKKRRHTAAASPSDLIPEGKCT